VTRRSLGLALARRFVRGRRLLYSSLAVGVAAAFLVTVYMTLQALSLTTEQRVEQELGRFASSVDLGGLLPDIPPGGPAPIGKLNAAAKRVGLGDIAVELRSFDVPVASPSAPRVFYAERDWEAEPLPRRYALTAGRWPSRPGEVTLTNPGEIGFGAPGEVELFSGRGSFDVVGFAEDRYGVFPQFLAAPGTWATLDPRLSRDFPATLATLRVHGSTTDERRMARFVLAAGGRASDEAQQGIEDVAQKVETSVTLARTAEAVWFDRLPAAHRVPAVFLPLLAVLLMIALNDRWLRRRLLVLTDAGVPRRHAANGLMAAVLGVAVAAVVIGSAAGWLLGLAARPLLAAAHPLPLSPAVIPVTPVLSSVAVVLVGWLSAAAAVRFGRFERREHSARLRRRSRRWRDVRHLAALTAACVAIVRTAELRTAPDTMMLAAFVAVAVVLLTPELVGWAAARLGEQSSVAMLAKRQLVADRRRATLVVAVMAASLGLPLGFLTLLDTTLATEQSERVPEVRPDQIHLSGVGGSLTPPSRRVQQRVAEELGSEPKPVAIGFLGRPDGSSLVTASALGDTFILAVDDVAGVQDLVGRPLSARDQAALRDGGMLAWDAPEPTQRLVHTGGPNAPTVDVPARSAPRPRVAWAQGTQGVMLSETARTLRFPLARAAIFYSGLTDGQAARARRAVAAAGLDPDQVTVYEEPATVVPRAAQAAAAIALALLVLCIGLSVARAQVAALQRYLGTLLAIGIAPAWPRRVLLRQQAVALGLGTALALAVALPPVFAAAWLVPDVILSIPWTWLVAVIGAVYGSMVLVTLVAARSLRADVHGDSS
jgi:hypothetical protein